MAMALPNPARVIGLAGCPAFLRLSRGLYNILQRTTFRSQSVSRARLLLPSLGFILPARPTHSVPNPGAVVSRCMPLLFGCVASYSSLSIHKDQYSPCHTLHPKSDPTPGSKAAKNHHRLLRHMLSLVVRLFRTHRGNWDWNAFRARFHKLGPILFAAAAAILSDKEGSSASLVDSGAAFSPLSAEHPENNTSSNADSAEQDDNEEVGRKPLLRERLWYFFKLYLLLVLAVFTTLLTLRPAMTRPGMLAKVLLIMLLLYLFFRIALSTFSWDKGSSNSQKMKKIPSAVQSHLTENMAQLKKLQRLYTLLTNGSNKQLEFTGQPECYQLGKDEIVFVYRCRGRKAKGVVIGQLIKTAHEPYAKPSKQWRVKRTTVVIPEAMAVVTLHHQDATDTLQHLSEEEYGMFVKDFLRGLRFEEGCALEKELQPKVHNTRAQSMAAREDNAMLLGRFYTSDMKANAAASEDG